MLMKTIKNISHIRSKPRVVVTIGTYDGLHLGHRQVIRKTVVEAQKRNIASCVITFTEHPLRLFTPRYPSRLVPNALRQDILKTWGIDYCIMLTFSRKLACKTPEAFIQYLCKALDIKKIVVGFNFRFGHNNTGDVSTLQELGRKYGFSVHREKLKRIRLFGEIISSTVIRRALQSGNIKKANMLLGREYAVFGTVQRGKQFGRKMGYPTINVHIREQLTPMQGVYLGVIIVAERQYPAMMYIGDTGNREISRKETSIIEAYIFDFNQNLYRQKVEVLILHYMRSIREFPNADELQHQLNYDEEKARNYFTKRKNNKYSIGGTRAWL